MYCKCKEVVESVTTHVVNYKGCVIVIKNVPCEECEQCGEKFYSNEVARHLEKIVNVANTVVEGIISCFVNRE
jgi:YgiT-type zinc finger domain-containing protein